MPRVKFDYIVSFSSEDPEHPASNLLSVEVSKKKWLCAAGESSGSVVLQLEKAVQICTVAVGAHHAAIVEVLVGRSETPAEPFQVLVASCVFLSPSESRKAEGAAVERVRSFSLPGESGEGPRAVWAQCWDRLRVLVSQPYNKHCKFGVSFVHVFSSDTASAPSPTRPSLLNALDNLSSDEDEFKPGELFAQHKTEAYNTTTTDTGSQIRRASSQVVRSSALSSTSTSVGGSGAAAAGLLVKTSRKPTSIDRTTLDHRKRTTERERERDVERKRKATHKCSNTPTTYKHTDTEYVEQIKRNRDTMNTTRDNKQKSPLAGVVCVLSGYVNPRRASVRNAALALGATLLRDWDSTCTHLICAFPKTPKLRAVRDTAGGARVPVVLAEWVEESARLGRRLPEEWFSTEVARRVPVPEGGLDSDSGGDRVSLEDTDDEIERVLRGEQDRPPASADRSRDPSSSPARDLARARARARAANESSEDEDEDEEYGETTDVDVESDDEDRDPRGEGRSLPPLLRDMVFLSGGERVDRYVRAYGGTLIPVEEVEGAGDERGEVYALCEAGAGAGTGATAGVQRLSLGWLWRAHRTSTLPPLHTYILD